MGDAASKILDALLDIHSSGPLNERYGICANVREYLDDPALKAIWEDSAKEAFREWDEFSGLEDYPIQHPERAEEAYKDLMVDKWDKSTPYGAARYRLLDHLIKWYGDRV